MPYNNNAISLYVLPGAQGVIASQGRGDNFFDTDGDGYGTRTKAGGTGESRIGADKTRNGTVSIEVRGGIWGSSARNAIMANSIYQEQGTTTIQRAQWNSSNGTIKTMSPPETMGGNWGTLAFLGENDVILSSIHGDDMTFGIDFSSVFRGFVYSKRRVQIQIDLLIQGMLMGKDVTFADPGSLGPGFASATDGNDLSFYKEDALDSGFFPRDLAPKGTGIASREMSVLSWENNVFYKK